MCIRDRLQIFQELFTCFLSTLYTKAENAALPFRQVFLRQLIVAVALQSRIIDPFHHRVILQMLCQFLCIFTVAFHSQVECLQSLVSQISIHRRHAAAEITNQNSSQSGAEGSRSEFFVEPKSVIAFVRFSQPREFIRSTPVKFSAFYNCTCLLYTS